MPFLRGTNLAVCSCEMTSHATDPLTKPLVMVIDDSVDIRETVGMIIEGRGYRVVLAEHGRDALDRIRDGRLRPAAVVLDLQMPVMDGWAFLAAQRDEPLLADTRVIVASADRLLRDGWPANVCAVLQKPTAMFLLLAALRCACRRPDRFASGTGLLPDLA
jgi:CheY-like chemotaxis protein